MSRGSPPGWITAAEASRFYGVSPASIHSAANARRWERGTCEVAGKTVACYDVDDVQVVTSDQFGIVADYVDVRMRLACRCL